MTQRERVQASLEAEHDHGCYPQRCPPSEVHPLQRATNVGDWRERLTNIERLLDEVMVGHTPRNPGAHRISCGEITNLGWALADVRLLLAEIARTA